MSHQVTPISFRSGKTFLWKNNVLSDNSSNLGKLSFNKGIERTMFWILKKRRFFMVKGNLLYSYKMGIIRYKFIYIPRIKLKPEPSYFGMFAKSNLLKNINWNSERRVIIGMDYTDKRRDKTYKFAFFNEQPQQLNKWLTKRMLRGSSITRFKQSYQKKFNIEKLSNMYSKKFEKVFYSTFSIKNRFVSFIKYLKKNKNSNIKNKKFIPWLCTIKTYLKKNIKKSNFRLQKVIVRRFYNYKSRWPLRWMISNSRPQRKLNIKYLSHLVSLSLKRKIKLFAVNFFVYLASKNMITYKTHQEHFWNHKYRFQRFYYYNYYDIINSLFIMGVIKNSHSLFLFIIRMLLPRLEKIRRFMYFIDGVVKAMPQIQKSFSCFIMIFTGKLAGGTKRTKNFKVGYGFLPFQSLTVESDNDFIQYTHKWGEFGVKLLLCKTVLKKIKYLKQNQWSLKKKLPIKLKYTKKWRWKQKKIVFNAYSKNMFKIYKKLPIKKKVWKINGKNKKINQKHK